MKTLDDLRKLKKAAEEEIMGIINKLEGETGVSVDAIAMTKEQGHEISNKGIIVGIELEIKL